MLDRKCFQVTIERTDRIRDDQIGNDCDADTWEALATGKDRTRKAHQRDNAVLTSSTIDRAQLDRTRIRGIRLAQCMEYRPASKPVSFGAREE